MSKLVQKLFGTGKKDGKGPSPQEAIQRLREIEEMLAKKSEFLEKKINEQNAVAKKNARTNKRVALNALKKKHRFDKQLTQIDGTLSTIEFQREGLENASTNTEVFKAMDYAAQALKGAHQGLDIDKVQDVMDDIQDQHELSQEISNAISTPAGFDMDLDEDELNAELEELEQEELDEQLLNVGGTVDVDELPAIPSSDIPVPSKAKAEDDDLRELEAWAS
ncbi:charged multivesicular body protein 4b-like [Tubulanus polymorphus]|uniref:charged multivesicular body protein 4b-like n=1 Tax=Tubulanus polymorphus TaxID=672921 RepID=UPI003DA33C0D